MFIISCAATMSSKMYLEVLNMCYQNQPRGQLYKEDTGQT